MKLVSFQKRQLDISRNTVPDDGAMTTPAHYHELYEIYFLLEGSCDYFIGSRTYHLTAGDLVLIPEGVIHNTVYHSTGHSRLLVNCASRYVPASARPKGYIYRNAALTEKLRELLEAAEAEYNAADRFSEEAVSCHIRLLFYLLARNPNQYDAAGTENGAVSRAAAWLQLHFTEDVTLPELAEIAAVSPEHLSRLFRKETGFGFREYRSLLRLQKAEQLLKQRSGASVAEIAAECGFSDSNYFSVAFKKVYGFSPKQVQR